MQILIYWCIQLDK